MPVVADDVVRYTVWMEMDNEPVANIIDARLDTLSRADDITNLAGVLINQWAGDIMPSLSNDISFERVSWVDLDNLEGEVGERSSTGTVTLPVAGGIGTQAMPNNAAVLVRKLTTSARNERSGRLYLAGVAMPGATVGTSQISAGQAGLLQTAFDSFHTNFDQDSPYLSRWCVVHRGPTLETSTSTDISGTIVETSLASQKGRLIRN